MSRNVKFGMYMNNEYTYKLRSNIDFNLSLTIFRRGEDFRSYMTDKRNKIKAYV